MEYKFSKTGEDIERILLEADKNNHRHYNKEILDKITDEKINEWNKRVDVIHQGDTEPTDENIILWVDTSEGGEYTGELEDKVILEFREMFKYLTGKIEELQFKNIELESRILYLEEYGGGISKPENPPENPPETPSGDNVIMAFEDGSMLVDENGILLAFETISTASNETKLIFETGEILVDENNNILILEK